jgi:nitroimidazol reductase NimA-like FMN-containing flavoprotein (pyridoxamine 5'-phosphate oxidase superfamily)
MAETNLSRINTHPDRAVNDDERIIHLLETTGMGVLATEQQDQPFTSTLLFAYDRSHHTIYLHTARRGRVWENVQAETKACFTCGKMGRLLPADTALNFSVEYESVVVFGPIYLIEDPQEAEAGLQLLLDKYAPHLRPGRDYRPITRTELAATAVYRLDVNEWSAKRKQAPEDFPGAYDWPDD